MLLLCHHCTKLYDHQKDQYNLTSSRYDEPEILNFVKNFGYEFLNSNHPDLPSIYTVKC